jgi:uncharacterized protein (TIGR03437 family)
MSHTRYYFKLLLLTVALFRTCYGQASCFPLNGADVNHPNGLLLQLVPAKTYTGPRQNTTSTYISQAAEGQAFWDSVQGLHAVGATTVQSAVKTELAACVPTPVNPPVPPPQAVPYYNTPLVLASHALVVTDLNRDGFADAIVAVPGTNQIWTYLANPDGTFKDPVKLTIGNSATKLTSIGVADLNNDKKSDFAVVDSANNAVYVYFGKGDGTFFGPSDGPVAPITLKVGHAPSALTLTDVNADGNQDIVVTNTGDNSVSVIRGLGNGTFIPASTFAVGKAPVSVIALDINADGNVDLVVADSGSNDIAELFGQGTGGFQSAVFTKTPAPPTFLGSADFNSDGIPDLVVLAQDAKAVMMFTGAYQGKLNLAGTFLVPYLAASISVFDFDGDNNLDLLVPDTDSGSAVLLLGRGDGTLIAPPVYAGTAGFSAVATGDLNGDGKPDLVVTGTNPTTSSLSFLAGTGSGQFQAPVNIPVPGPTNFVAVADFNKDGRPDMVVSGTQVTVLTNLGNGTFQQSGPYPNLIPTAIGDFNKDGHLDIAGPSNGGVGLLLGNGDGTFHPGNSVAAGSNPKTAAAADFNGDGALDIAVLDAGTPGNTSDAGGISILLGNGAGSFPKVSGVTAGFNPRAMAVGDVNGDGKPDLVVATGANAASSSFQISVFLGKGDATFQPPFNIPVPAGESPNTIAIVDLDGDGNPDIVLGDCCADSSVGYFRGNGDGTFQPLVAFYGGNTVRGIAIADLNGDGKPDLALVDSPADNPSLSAVIPLINHVANVPAMTTTSGASFLPSLLAPDAIMTAFGTNLTTGTASATGDPSTLPTTLANTTVTIQDSKGVARLAQVFFVSPTQINYLVPTSTALGLARVSVTAPNGVTSTLVNVISTAPGLFMANSSGLAAGGGVLVAGIQQSSFNLSYTDPTTGAVSPQPIYMGTRLDQVFLTLFGTGFRNRTSLDAVNVMIGGLHSPALYAGPQSQFLGLDQLNFMVPFSLAGSGNVTITVSVNGVSSNPVTVNIQ